VANHVLHEAGQSFHIMNCQSAGLALDQAVSREVIQFPRDGLTMRTDPASKLDMGWGRSNHGHLLADHVVTGQTQQFGVDTIPDGQGAELEHRSVKARIEPASCFNTKAATSG